MCLVVPGTSPHRSVAELVNAAKVAPAPLLWGSSGSGGIGHLTGELFAHRAGFRGEFVPYRGGSAVLEAMRKAEIDFSAEVLASAWPHVRDGSSRALAVTSPGRHPLLPDVPSLQEQGFAGFDIVTFNVLQAPKGMDPALALKLNRAAMAALAEPALRQRLAAAGIDPAGPSTPGLHARLRRGRAGEVPGHRARNGAAPRPRLSGRVQASGRDQAAARPPLRSATTLAKQERTIARSCARSIGSSANTTRAMRW
jgi:tripartite-type tricarboxylate transporter receptor subunit TctC